MFKKNNILILCPTHHAMFDLGTITFDPRDGKSIIDLFEENSELNGKEIKLKHDISIKNIKYHFNIIFNNGEGWEF